MRRILSLALVLCVLLSVSALAAVRAVPNQKLAFRTGPNTKYVELYTLPQSTDITAIEYEEGNGVTWVLVEFTYQGERVRAYTGLKRMSVQGNIAWATHLWSTVNVNTTGQVYAAPSGNAAYRGRVDAGESVTLLRYDGAYAFIEFYDAANGATSRGWIPDWMVDDEGYYDEPDAVTESTYDYQPPNYSYGSSGVSATPNQKLSLRTGPNTKYVELYTLPQSTPITAYEYEEGNGVTWVLVEFFYQGQRVRGYTGLKRMSVHGSIPWADGGTGCSVYQGGTVYAAPSYDAAYRGKVNSGERVTLLGYENGYAYIEFYDGANGALSRGYIEDWRI